MTMEVVLGTAAVSGLGFSGMYLMVMSKIQTCAVLAVSSLVVIAETTCSMRPGSPASCRCLCPYEWRWRVERIMMHACMYVCMHVCMCPSIYLSMYVSVAEQG